MTVPMKRRSAFCYLIPPLFLVLIVFIGMGPVSAEEGAPVFGQTLGDWIIESGDNVTVTEDDIRVNGNLIVKSGGILNVEYSVIRMKGVDEDEPFMIHIEEGGTLYAKNSWFTYFVVKQNDMIPRPNLPL
jgi:hypothetical protein